MNRKCKFCQISSDVQFSYKYKLYVPQFSHFFRLHHNTYRDMFSFNEVIFCINCATKMNEAILVHNNTSVVKSINTSLKVNTSKRIVKKPIFPPEHKKHKLSE